MKILVCTDGSEHSQKAVEKASLLAEGPNVDEVTIINVFEDRLDLSFLPLGAKVTEEDMENFERLLEENQNDRNKIMKDALKVFEEKNIIARSISKEGRPADTIVKVAKDEGFDLIILGSRGLNSLEKIYLGSVSSTVIQEAQNSSVMIVR
jgi:nucleotide-binding universal stress UspA family protein